jgi:hypothetical protein
MRQAVGVAVSGPGMLEVTLCSARIFSPPIFFGRRAQPGRWEEQEPTAA